MTEKSLKNDILFRYIFGAEHNKNILISLLNPIIELLELPEITDIKVINSFLEIDGIDNKKPVVDIRAVDNEGKLYNIEMQVGKEIDYKKRSLVYLTKMYSSQLKQGQKYQDTKTCIGIHFLDYVLEPDIDDFYSTYGFMHLKKACHPHSNDLYLIYIELPKVNYNHGEFTQLKKWLYLIENVYKKEDPVIQTLRKDVPEIDQAAIEYENFIADLRFQHAIQAREMAEMDYASGIGRALEEGKAQGLAEGEAKGLAITARNLKAEGFDNEKISKLTGLTIQEIEKL